MKFEFTGKSAKCSLMAKLDGAKEGGLVAPLEAEVTEPDAGSAGFNLRIRITQDVEVPLFIDVLRQGIPENGRSFDIRLWMEGGSAASVHEYQPEKFVAESPETSWYSDDSHGSFLRDN